MTPTIRRISTVPQASGKRLRQRLGRGCDIAAGSRIIAKRIRRRAVA